MNGDHREATFRVVRRIARQALLLVPTAFLLVACGGLDRTGLQNKIKADTNGYVGTAAVKAVRCNLDHSVAGASYRCIVVPSNGRKGIPVFVAVHGSKYTILRTGSSSAGQ